MLHAMDAFLYERGHSLLERAEGVSLARAEGLGVWSYVGVYNNWPRVIPNGLGLSTGRLSPPLAFGGRADCGANLRLRFRSGQPPLGQFRSSVLERPRARIGGVSRMSPMPP